MADGIVPDDTLKTLEAIEARLKQVEKTAEGVQSSTGKIAGELGPLRVTVDGMRTTVEAATEAAQTRIKELEVALARAKQLLEQVEDANRKANSESTFAFNAKGNAEEHAKVISQLRGVVEVEVAAVAASKKSAEDSAQAISSVRNASETEAKTIADRTASAIREAAVVTAAAERVAAVLPSIDQGSKDANAITAAKDGAEASAVAIQALQKEMSENSAKAASELASITKADEEIKKLASAMSEARTMASESQARLNEYEVGIKALTVAYQSMQDKLEGLLPHATSAGLASAFHNQKARFSKPQPYWLGLFVLAIVSLLIAASVGLPASNDTWDAIFRHFINRLPLVAPLVWLAIYAGHHYSMALRMEEDYAFKEAVSTAFEGYKREMLEIPATANSPISPLVTLCENVLQALSERPGRIYDGKSDLITPLTPITTLVKEAVAEAMKKTKAAD